MTIVISLYMRLARFGGLGAYAFTLARLAQERGHSPFLLLRIPPPDDLRVALDGHAIPYAVREMRSRLDIGYAWFLYRLLRRTRCDVTVGIFTPASHYLTVAAWLARCPVRTVQRHTSLDVGTPSRRRWRMTYVLNRGIASLVSAVRTAAVFIKDEQIESFGIPADKIVVFPNTLEVFPPAPEAAAEVRDELDIAVDSRIMLSVGRLIPSKGIAVLLDALPDVLRRHPDIVVLLVGQGPQREALLRRAETLGVRDAVRFCGARGDVPRLLAAATLAVFPTLAEGFSYFALEAQAAGRAIIASKVGAVPEIIEDGTTGILVAPGDASAFAAAMMSLLDNPETARRMGQAGRERVATQFNPSEVIGRELDCYEQLYAKTRKHPE